MMKKSFPVARLFITLLTLLASASCDSAKQQYHHLKVQLEPAAKEVAPIQQTSEKHDFQLLTLLNDLYQPWSMAFLPDGTLLITEKAGALYRYDPATGDKRAIAGVPETRVWGQGGLMDVLPHPDFINTRWVYLSYTGLLPDDLAATRVARGKLNGDRLEAVEILFTALPALKPGAHFGSVLAFDHAGNLYITSGERHNRPLVQKLDNHIGKIIRLKDNGDIPSDNPFAERENALPEIFSYGHRNPQGIAVHPQTGQIWSVEHGPRGGDEVNIIEAGKNYGWPVITYGQEYIGGKIGEGTQKPGMEQPVYYYVPSIAPSNMIFYQGQAFPKWRGNLLIGALKLTHINRLELDDNQVVHEERLMNNLGMRIRSLAEGPDGFIYILTDSGLLLQLRPR